MSNPRVCLNCQDPVGPWSEWCARCQRPRRQRQTQQFNRGVRSRRNGGELSLPPEKRYEGPPMPAPTEEQLRAAAASRATVPGLERAVDWDQPRKGES